MMSGKILDKKVDQQQEQKQDQQEANVGKNQEKAKVLGLSDEDYEGRLALMKVNVENFFKQFNDQFAGKSPELVLKESRDKIWQSTSQLYKFSSAKDDLGLNEEQSNDYGIQVADKFSKEIDQINWLCELAIHIFELHADDRFLTDDASEIENFRIHSAILILIINSFHYFTDRSVEMCQRLSEIEAFFTKFANPLLAKWLEGHTEKKYESSFEIILCLLGTIFNLFYKNDSKIFKNLTKFDLVQQVKPYLHSDDFELQLVALVLIAFALDESQSDVYLGAKEVIEMLVKMLGESLSSADRRSHGFHVSELAACTNRLALNDVNKKLLVELNLLIVLQKMCNSTKDDEVAASLDILFTLSFNEANKDLIKTQFSERLRTLLQDESQRPRGQGVWRDTRSLQGIDFNLNEEISNPTSQGGRPQSGRQLKRRQTDAMPLPAQCLIDSASHVMISYQHECKPIVVKIKEQLDQAGVKVWIDYEHMATGANVLSSMADAVESSSAFLMCMSRKYKESNNCRLEAEYAWKTGKRVIPLMLEFRYKPDGWLGLMLGMQFYHDFSGKYPFEDKVRELVQILVEKEVKEETKPKQAQRSETDRRVTRPRSSDTIRSGRGHQLPTPYSPLPPIADARTPLVATDLRGWTRDRTLCWAEECDVREVIEAAALTGEELHFLLICRQRAPEAFYRFAERLLPAADTKGLVRFVNALEGLA